MGRQISITITVGVGSERHNHDLDYRKGLPHVHSREDGVIELIPYISYKEQINNMMRPYIDEYNRKQEERYKAAWDRYNSGQIRTKPRKANYKPLEYDYYNNHINDTYFNRAMGQYEKMPMFRSLIVGLGDKNDRQNRVITEAEAVYVIRRLVELWPQVFPDFKLLGATLHLDEQGFYHVHIDYKPLYKTSIDQGLPVGIGQESALEHMGFQPEQSIINGRDKVPIRFNAFRNKLYQEIEQALNDVGIRFMYGVSEIKEPEKNSGKNQRLSDWQATQDGVLQLQKLKNHMLDIVEMDEVSPQGYAEAIAAAKGIEETMEQINSQPRSRLNKNNVVVSFHLLDQLQSFTQSMVNTIGHLFQRIEILEEYYDFAEETEEKLNVLQQENEQLKKQLEWHKKIDNQINRGDVERLEKEVERYRHKYSEDLREEDIFR